MARSVDEYTQLFLNSLPRGDAYTRDLDSNIAKFYSGVAVEFFRFEQRVERLIEEGDWRTAFELLPEWEKDWGLPADCTGPLETITARRAALGERIVNIPDQSRKVYIDKAANLGYPITITEYSSGDSVPGHPEVPAVDAGFVVQINAGTDTPQFRHFGDQFGGAYGIFGNDLLECALREISQTHHYLIFSYT